MSNIKPRDLARSDKSAVSNIQDSPPLQVSALRPNDRGEQASSLIGRVTLESTLEIDRLIDDLNKLRRKLEDEGNRLQRDLVEHSSFSQSVIQLTKIVSDSMVHVKGVSSSSNKSQIQKRSDRDPTDTETHIPAFLTGIEQV